MTGFYVSRSFLHDGQPEYVALLPEGTLTTKIEDAIKFADRTSAERTTGRLFPTTASRFFEPEYRTTMSIDGSGDDGL